MDPAAGARCTTWQMRRWLSVALVPAAVTAALAATAASGGRPGAPAPLRGPLLGVLDAHGELQLGRLDPATLRVRGAARLGVGTAGCALRSGGEVCSSIPPWSLSPGGRRVAIASNERHSARALRIVDVERLRPVADIRLTGDPVGLVAWLGRRRLLAGQDICCQERQSAAWIDATSGRVLARGVLEGSVLRVARIPTGLVALVATPNAIGPASLELAGADGAVRGVPLERVLAGVRLLGTDAAPDRVERHVPGLAVDWPGRRAFVVAAGLVAQVDLRTLAVSYHSLRRTPSLLERGRGWLDPEADAKSAGGPARSAVWLGDGRLAVTGADEERPAGLAFVDTR